MNLAYGLTKDLRFLNNLKIGVLTGNAKLCRRCGRRNYSGRGGVAVAAL